MMPFASSELRSSAIPAQNVIMNMRTMAVRRDEASSVDVRNHASRNPLPSFRDRSQKPSQYNENGTPAKTSIVEESAVGVNKVAGISEYTMTRIGQDEWPD
jgi:hypothetical protein